MANKSTVSGLRPPRVRPGSVVSAEGELVVARSQYGQETSESVPIHVRPFATQPAFVEIGKGRTINLGNYESARVDVKITVPCYREEVRQVFSEVDSMVGELLGTQVNEILVGAGLKQPSDGSGPRSEVSIEEIL